MEFQTQNSLSTMARMSSLSCDMPAMTNRMQHMTALSKDHVGGHGFKVEHLDYHWRHLLLSPQQGALAYFDGLDASEFSEQERFLVF